MKTEQAHSNEQWKKMRFDQFFDMLPTNTLSRDKLNNQRGEYQNIHYGDVLIKYSYCLDCNVNDIPYINEGVRFNTAQVKNGDVIFADTAEDDTVGKCVEVLNVGDRKIVSGLHTYFCRPKHEMAPGYLGYFLNSNHFHNQLLPYIAGSKVSSVNRTSIARTFIFYPESLPAQRRIAAILSSADKVIASTQKVIAKYKQMKQGMMEDLLKPKEGWKMVKLGDVVTVFDGTHQTPYYVENGIPFYSVENVTSNEFEHTKYITEEEHLLLTQKHKIEKGDILMTRIGSIGVCKLVDWDVNASFYVSLALLKMKEGFDAKYLVFYSQTEAFKRSILHESLTFAYPQKINLGDICNVEMFVPYKKNAPDLVEQRRIAAILSGIDAKIAAEEKVLEKYGKMKKGMMERLLNATINKNNNKI
ncbi:MAG: restriction endonuclease subunit S [Bacteroidales bacterium]|nr:restriction endonuclease subunit S [Bacteroidales bacterium]MBQ6101198.1 restriction endonuclease subunit S [Bacteroidales bacterium]